MNAALKNLSKAAYPTTGASSGVYLPYTTSSGNVCPCALTGGGIYVEGNATVTITASGATAQVYTIVNNSTTTTVTIDTSANTTTIASGASSLTLTGVPTQKDATGAFQRNATMLYVNGNISALKGGGEGVGTIQDSTALDVVANGSVTITGDIKYKSEPVTLTQSGSTAPDTLIPANNHGQTVGIYTSNGNVNLANAQSDGNLEIDATIAAISSSGSGGLVNTGSAINTLTIVGGRIQNTIPEHQYNYPKCLVRPPIRAGWLRSALVSIHHCDDHHNFRFTCSDSHSESNFLGEHNRTVSCDAQRL